MLVGASPHVLSTMSTEFLPQQGNALTPGREKRGKDREPGVGVVPELEPVSSAPLPLPAAHPPPSIPSYPSPFPPLARVTSPVYYPLLAISALFPSLGPIASFTSVNAHRTTDLTGSTQSARGFPQLVVAKLRT